jgi:hypothetical protein
MTLIMKTGQKTRTVRAEQREYLYNFRVLPRAFIRFQTTSIFFTPTFAAKKIWELTENME